MANTTGKKFGGRVAGTPNKVTLEFREALNNLLNFAAPQMVEWLERVAETDPAKALDQMGKLAEYVHPKLGRIENQITGKDGGPVQVNANVTFVRPE